MEFHNCFKIFNTKIVFYVGKYIGRQRGMAHRSVFASFTLKH